MKRGLELADEESSKRQCLGQVTSLVLRIPPDLYPLIDFYTIKPPLSHFNMEEVKLDQELGSIHSVCQDLQGNIYASDFEKFKIFRWSTSGKVTVAAGNGTKGHADGPADQARVDPLEVLTDSKGDLFFMQDLSLRKLSNGVVTTLPGNFDGCSDLAIDDNDFLYTCDFEGRVCRVQKDGRLTTFKIRSECREIRSLVTFKYDKFWIWNDSTHSFEKISREGDIEQTYRLPSRGRGIRGGNDEVTTLDVDRHGNIFCLFGETVKMVKTDGEVLDSKLSMFLYDYFL